jgi:hypothetical protein
MSTTLQPDFRERVKANDVPVPRLIGFPGLSNICGWPVGSAKRAFDGMHWS